MQQSRHFYLVKIWFVIDIVIALAPQLYWAANTYKASSILGLPVPLIYFLTVSISITASILYAYWVDASNGEFAS